MPYYVSDENPDCSGWAVEKDDGEVVGCHRTRQEAIDQMVALSIEEDIEPGGERAVDAKAIPEDRRAPEGARAEARRGLEWRDEYNRGGTPVGVARARDISNGANLSVETIGRMVSYFARHEVDKQGQGWSPGEDGYPSAGRIAWALWGGDPGRSWANRLWDQIQREREASADAETRKSTRRRGMAKVQHKSVAATFEVKAANDDAPNGEVTALVSVFGNTDLVGDRVMPGAFEKSLKSISDAGKSIPFVWSHQWSDPNAYIGKVVKAEETEKGLVVTASLFATETAQHIKTLLAEGVVTEFSFAYDIIDEAKGKDGVNELLELHVLEVGPTLKGANPATELMNVRSLLGNRKAEPGELDEGSWVEWAGDGYGRVEHVMTEGTFGVEGDPLSLEATEDDPLAMVRVYEEAEADGEERYVATEMFLGFRFSELTVSEQKSGSREKRGARSTAQKVGRAISGKNQSRLEQARELIGEVLSSIEVEEPVKAEEPQSAVKVEELGMSADVALALVELAELDTE